MMHCYFRTAGSVNITILASGDLDYTVALFGWPFYIGVFVIGLIGIARLAAHILPMCKSLVEIIMLIVAIYLFQELVAEWVESIQHFFVYHELWTTFHAGKTCSWGRSIWRCTSQKR